MPEGDTIFRAARTLARALTGKVVTRFDTAYAQAAGVDVDHPVAGRTVEEVRAAGKHLLMRFSGDLVLRTHMRMSGSWHIYRPGERWQRPRSAMRVLIETADFVAVGFDVPVVQLGQGQPDELRRLGPDLLDPAFDAEAALQRLRARADREIGEALLDQSALAGAGNIYKNETLFLCGLSPFTPVAALDDQALRAVVTTARGLLVANASDAHHGGIVTYRGARPGGRIGDRSARLWVYGRAGKPCRRCATPIEVHRQGPHARVTYLCPRCQPVRSCDPLRPLP